jgi:hypothetical protein
MLLLVRSFLLLSIVLNIGVMSFSTSGSGATKKVTADCPGILSKLRNNFSVIVIKILFLPLFM